MSCAPAWSGAEALVLDFAQPFFAGELCTARKAADCGLVGEEDFCFARLVGGKDGCFGFLMRLGEGGSAFIDHLGEAVEFLGEAVFEAGSALADVAGEGVLLLCEVAQEGSELGEEQSCAGGVGGVIHRLP
jgi:hypothetical protein